tara:strand:- start:386 stop:1843 length:1458 start_codon:yes stop_codon:yes gene_type:complete
MAVKHSLIVEYKNIKKFKNKEEYLIQKIKPQSFVINRDLKDRFAVIKIYYDEAKFYGRDTKTTKFKKITGADLEVYKEAKKYLSATEDAMLMDAWDNARQNGYWKSGLDDRLSEYDTAEPSELLSNALYNKGLSVKEATKDDYSTMYKVLKGSGSEEGRELTRAKAIEYAKAIGCDPASLMFNKLKVPLWGTVDLSEEKKLKEKKEEDELGIPGFVEKSYGPGRIAVSTKVNSVICPRDLYLPTVKAIAINSKDSIYDGMIAYYYHTNKISDEAINKMCVVGYHVDSSFTIGKTKIGGEEDRYYFGIYRIYGTKKKLINPDPNIPETDLRHIILDDFTPSFVAPIISLASADALENKDTIPVQKLQTVGQLIRKDELNKIDKSKLMFDFLKPLHESVWEKVDKLKDVKQGDMALKLDEAGKKVAEQMMDLVAKQNLLKLNLKEHLRSAEAEIENAKRSKRGIASLIPDLVVDDKIIEFKSKKKQA